MPLSGLWDRLTAGIFGAGIGIATADAVVPVLEPAKQKAWADNQNRVFGIGTIAELVAQALVELPWATDEAARNGYDPSRVRAAAEAVLTAPGTSELLQLWRRGEIDADAVEHGLRKAKLEPQWDAAIRALHDVLLSAQDLAVMVQRGIVENEGLLPVGPPTAAGKVPPMPRVDIDPVAEAGKSGWTKERLAALARIIGLPASPDLAARMVFRGIIDRVDFDRAVSEGNTRNEWAPFLFEGFREILTAHDYAELELRGYLTRDARLAGTGRHGMSTQDSDLLFNVLGRSIPVHQITTGQARGGHYNGPSDHIPEEYLSSLRRGNLRPEYYSLAYANRYSLPGAFIIRQMAQGGDLPAARVEQLLLWSGWPPELAAEVTKSWTGKAGAAPESHVGKAATSLYTAQHHAYVAGHATEAEAEATLAHLEVPAAARAQILELWKREREITPHRGTTPPTTTPPPA